jgi:hypothetical protein
MVHFINKLSVKLKNSRTYVSFKIIQKGLIFLFIGIEQQSQYGMGYVIASSTHDPKRHIMFIADIESQLEFTQFDSSLCSG